MNSGLSTVVHQLLKGDFSHLHEGSGIAVEVIKEPGYCLVSQDATYVRSDYDLRGGSRPYVYKVLKSAGLTIRGVRG